MELENHVLTILEFSVNLYGFSQAPGGSLRILGKNKLLKMADPTIQTFCCYSYNSSDTTHSIMREFNVDGYNAVCMFSSTLGILGALYQILPRRQLSRNHRWISFSAERGRKIVWWLAASDLLASLGVLIRASLWLNYKDIMPATGNDNDYGTLFCTMTSAWIQYFYTATWIWTLCYAIDMRHILSDKVQRIYVYHVAAWLLPAVLTIAGLSLLYVPDITCRTATSTSETFYRILPNYVAVYIPIAVVMIANPCLYHSSCKDMERILMCTTGQFTKRERDIVDAIKIKFSAINIVFYLCWFPNLINGFLLWTLWFELPLALVISIWYMMALTNPLQALFNCLVYRRWNGESEMVMVPWRREQEQEETNSAVNSIHTPSVGPEEQISLLSHFRRTSINRYGNCS